MTRVWPSKARAPDLFAIDFATRGDAATTSCSGISRTASTAGSRGNCPVSRIETSLNAACWPGRGSRVSTWMSMPG